MQMSFRQGTVRKQERNTHRRSVYGECSPVLSNKLGSTVDSRYKPNGGIEIFVL